MGEKDADSLAFYYIYRRYTSSWMKSKKNSKLISNLFLHANSAFSSLRWSKPLKDSTLFNQSAAPSQFIFWDVDLVGVNEISNRCPKGATMTLHPKQECVYTTERFQGVFSLVLNLATVSVTGIMRRYLLKNELLSDAMLVQWGSLCALHCPVVRVCRQFMEIRVFSKGHNCCLIS